MVLAPGIMARPGLKALGIGAEAHVNIFKVICQRRAQETDFGDETVRRSKLLR